MIDREKLASKMNELAEAGIMMSPEMAESFGLTVNGSVDEEDYSQEEVESFEGLSEEECVKVASVPNTVVGMADAISEWVIDDIISANEE